MGMLRDIANYAAVSVVALAFFLAFWLMVREFLGGLSVYLYKYESTIVLLSILFVSYLITNALKLEPINFVLAPFHWIKKNIKKG